MIQKTRKCVTKFEVSRLRRRGDRKSKTTFVAPPLEAGAGKATTIDKQNKRISKIGQKLTEVRRIEASDSEMTTCYRQNRDMNAFPHLKFTDALKEAHFSQMTKTNQCCNMLLHTQNELKREREMIKNNIKEEEIVGAKDKREKSKEKLK